MRTLAIGDIHGCRATLDFLLDLVRLQPEDILVTLGDYIDRGPDSRGVIDRLLELYQTGRMVPLRGNHEIMMNALRSGGQDDIEFWLRCGGLETMESYAAAGSEPDLGVVPETHWWFIEQVCRDWFETETHIFVHANLHPALPLDAQTTEFVHWQGLSAHNHKPHISGKTMICGHTEQRAGVPLVLDQAICIDTWAYGGGWLTCLDTTSGNYWQANALGNTRTGSVSRA